MPDDKINGAELGKIIAKENYGLTISNTRRIITLVFEKIEELMGEEREIAIRNFGTFGVKDRTARKLVGNLKYLGEVSYDLEARPVARLRFHQQTRVRIRRRVRQKRQRGD